MIPGELDLGDRYDLNVVLAPLVRHLLLLACSLSEGGWRLELLKQEAPTRLPLLLVVVIISVPSDEIFQLSDVFAIHLLLSIIFILKRRRLEGSSLLLI